MIERIACLRPRLAAALFALVVACATARAGVRAFADPPADKKEEPRLVTTEHEVTITGRVIKYKATAGEVPLLSDTLKPRARIFCTTYEVPGEDAAKRPITFAFNGGRSTYRFARRAPSGTTTSPNRDSSLASCHLCTPGL